MEEGKRSSQGVPWKTLWKRPEFKKTEPTGILFHQKTCPVIEGYDQKC